MTADGLPLELRERVLSAARTARAPGRAVPEVPVISPVEAFGRAADAFHGALNALASEQWRVPVLRDLDVQGLVGHLIGVEHDLQRALAGDAGVACADHVRSTQPAAVAQRGRAPGETHTEWRGAADRTTTLVRDADPDQVVVVHGVRLPLGALLVVRAFELWTHENDIRTATGLPLSVPDPAVLALMTDLATGFLRVGMARIGAGEIPVDLHLVLTGPGGGTWDVPLGDEGARRDGSPAELLLVADAVDFCRLVADRIEPARLDAHVRGVADTAAQVLRAAAALALD
jgi:uncharacterized protein (TIGR03083 family)